MVRWCWVNFQCQGVLLSLIIVGQGPTALTVGAGGIVLTFLLSSVITLFFLWETARYRLQILSQRAVKPKTTNQPSIQPIKQNTLQIKEGFENFDVCKLYYETCSVETDKNYARFSFSTYIVRRQDKVVRSDSVIMQKVAVRV